MKLIVGKIGIRSRHTSLVFGDRQDFLHTRILCQSNGRLRNAITGLCACQVFDDRSVHT